MRVVGSIIAALLCGGCFQAAATFPDAGQPDGQRSPDNTGGDGSSPVGVAGSVGAGSGGSDVGDPGFEPFDEEPCPDQPPPPRLEECDLLEDRCPAGLACFPFVTYPEERCASEQFGTACAVGGSGTQGQPCDPSGCAGGHTCVVGNVGTRCVATCALDGPNTCLPGLLCVPLDIAGVGICA